MTEPRIEINKTYMIVVATLTFVVPAVSSFVEHRLFSVAFTLDLVAKWFIFSAVGLRLFLAGIRQTATPEFTAKEIFHIDNPESSPIVRELGFANLCFGTLGIASIFEPEWRTASAFVSAIFYALAALLHAIKRPVGPNESFALWTDVLIFAVLLIYLVSNI